MSQKLIFLHDDLDEEVDFEDDDEILEDDFFDEDDWDYDFEDDDFEEDGAQDEEIDRILH